MGFTWMDRSEKNTGVDELVVQTSQCVALEGWPEVGILQQGRAAAAWLCSSHTALTLQRECDFGKEMHDGSHLSTWSPFTASKRYLKFLFDGHRPVGQGVGATAGPRLWPWTKEEKRGAGMLGRGGVLPVILADIHPHMEAGGAYGRTKAAGGLPRIHLSRI